MKGFPGQHLARLKPPGQPRPLRGLRAHWPGELASRHSWAGTLAGPDLQARLPMAPLYNRGHLPHPVSLQDLPPCPAAGSLEHILLSNPPLACPHPEESRECPQSSVPEGLSSQQCLWKPPPLCHGYFLQPFGQPCSPARLDSEEPSQRGGVCFSLHTFFQHKGT